MFRIVFSLMVLCLSGFNVIAQNVLHFTATSRYDHGTRQVSLSMFQDLCSQIGCTVTDDPLGDQFNTLAQLSQYQVVVFSNTSGNGILSSEQRNIFEQWVSAGGNVLGIHAASDTYRHSTSNGNNTGTWDFYAELIGASVQENPNHVAGTPTYAMTPIGNHPSTANIPNPWIKPEEYYYWENGYFGDDNQSVLEVEETIGPNGQVNSFDAARPISWYRLLPNGTKVFYTVLGHSASDYSSDQLFRTHLHDVLEWLLGSVQSIRTSRVGDIVISPNPHQGQFILMWDGTAQENDFAITDVVGQTVYHGHIASERTLVDIGHLPSGVYYLKMGDQKLITVLHK